MMLAMASSEEEMLQRVAAEAIIAAASKKDKCTSIISMGTGILKKLYDSKNDNIKVRALVVSVFDWCLKENVVASLSLLAGPV